MITRLTSTGTEPPSELCSGYGIRGGADCGVEEIRAIIMFILYHIFNTSSKEAERGHFVKMDGWMNVV